MTLISANGCIVKELGATILWQKSVIGFALSSSSDRLGYLIFAHSDIVSLKLAMRRALEAFKVFLA